MKRDGAQKEFPEFTRLAHEVTRRVESKFAYFGKPVTSQISNSHG